MLSDATILIVDDQPRLLELLSLTLASSGYCVLKANDGLAALDILRSQPVDLILADIAMPRMNGYQLHQRVLENPAWAATPFIFLTARALDSDIRYGKQLGVDDYLTKPIEPEDLLAAVRGRLRRARQLAALSAQFPASDINKPVFQLGRLRIDAGQHRVWQDDQPVSLSAREFKLLESLARQANQVVPLQELVKSTHDLETDYRDAGTLLRPLVRSLRRKLGHAAGDMGCIESVRGVGYQLVPSRLQSNGKA
jgi:DNA-binding response OmpR family regulator